MITEEEKRVYGVLEKLNIPYARFEHKAVYTIDEANKLDIDLPGHHCKNLFICDRKETIFMLVIIVDTKRINIKELSYQTGYKGLTFASEGSLYKYLGLTPGSVSPFGLINDIEKNVIVLLDRDIADGDYISFHPNVNTATISLKYKDFERFLEWCGNRVDYIKV